MALVERLASEATIEKGRLTISLAAIIVLLIASAVFQVYQSREISRSLEHHAATDTAIETAHPEVAKRVRQLEDASLRASLAAESVADAVNKGEARMRDLESRVSATQLILEGAFPSESRAARRELRDRGVEVPE